MITLHNKFYNIFAYATANSFTWSLVCGVAIKESSDAETKSRIIGCKVQMKTFFDLCLGQRQYSLTGKLPITRDKRRCQHLMAASSFFDC